MVGNTFITPGRIVKILRTLDDINQADFAREIGCSRATISSIELGTGEFSLKLRRKIAIHFHLPITIFIEGGLEIEECRNQLSEFIVGKLIPA